MKLFFIAILISGTLYAQNFNNGFRFYLPPYDSTTQKFLPTFPMEPIESDEFVSIDNEGHFAVNDTRINFWANNICDEQVFPQKQYAGKMVGRIRKLGYNLMRFHYFDGVWGDGRCIFTPGQSTRTLDPTNLDRMEYLINEFKKNGIYININLHVARKFNTLDGVPDADSLMNLAKSVTLFDPHLIMLQKEYARQLLTHVNPYTGKALVDDPVMAMVEITNENGFLHEWQSGVLRPIAEGGHFTMRHNNMLEDLWNEYLAEKYNTTEALKTAWAEGSSVMEEYMQNGGFENTTIEPFEFNILDEQAVCSGVIDNSTSLSGNNSFKITIDEPAQFNWQIMLAQLNLSIVKDSTYTLSFYSKSTIEQNITFSLQTQEGDYIHYGGYSTDIGKEWKKYTWDFEAIETNIGKIMGFFSFGDCSGDIWIDDISFVKAPHYRLKPDESLESGNVHRMNRYELDNYSHKRVRSLFEFYVDLQMDYYHEMYSFLKDELGVKVPVSGSNWLAGFADMKIQNEMDYIDHHSYWDHPYEGNFNNESMIKNPEASTITQSFATKVVEGKPFTVSEYNHAYPNRYQVEEPFFLAGYGAYHDADALMTFGISEGSSWGEGGEPDMILSSFNTGRHNVLSSFMPTFGWAFRKGLISHADNTLKINLSNDDIYDAFQNNDGFYMFTAGFPNELALTHKMRIADFNSSIDLNLSSMPSLPVSPYVSDTGELIWDKNGLFKIETEQLIGFVGFLNDFIGEQIGSVKIVNADKFAGVTLLALDEKELINSEKMLLTVGTRQLNTGTKWAADNKSLTNHGGEPTIIEPATVTLEIGVNADSILVHKLDPLGKETDYSKVYYPVSDNNFLITIDQYAEKSLWYGIETKWQSEVIRNVSLLQPNGGEQIETGTTYKIKWEQSNIEQLSIWFSSNNGTSWELVAANIDASVKEYNWIVPYIESSDCIIKIVADEDNTVCDQSSNVFLLYAESIENMINNGDFSSGLSSWDFFTNEGSNSSANVEDGILNIDITNGGTESWHVQLIQTALNIENGKMYDILFDASANSDRNILADVSRDGGDYKSYFNQSVSLTTIMNRFEYTFTMNSSTDNNSRFVFDIGNSNIGVKLDNIVLREHLSAKSISINSPTGGDVLIMDRNYNITWTSSDIDSINLYYKQLSQTSWNKIGDKLSAEIGKYTWKIPAMSPDSFQVKIEDAGDNSIYVVSDKFYIDIPSLTIISPTENDTLFVDNNFSISWLSKYIDSVNMYYKSSNTSTWTAIDSNVAASSGEYSWIVPDIASGYYLIKIEDNLYTSFSSVSDDFFVDITTSVNEANVPSEYALTQNYPNPFNPETTIKYSLPKSGFVILKIYDLRGREITTLISEDKSPGTYEVDFNASYLSSGIYFCKMQSGNFIETKKLLLLK